MISQNGDRVQFERLATPRPAPKVTLQSNWHTQQQQLTLNENATSIQETCVTRESQAEVRDDPKNATEMELASRILVRAISKVDVEYSSQYAGSHHRCVLEQRSEHSRDRTRENWFEQKLYSAKNLAVSFSKLGNVELTELKKPSMQCPSCLHSVFLRHNSLQMRNTNTLRSRRDEPD